MKTIKIILVSLFFIGFSGCNGQSQKENLKIAEANKEGSIYANDDSLDKPKIDVRVNKQYDSKGHIIKFDSSYSYFYSSPKGLKESVNDSIFNSFRSFFERSYPNYLNRQNNNVFFNDSLFKYDFFNDDYFQKRYQLNEHLFENMYQRMDSIKRDFMKRSYPNGYQKEKTI